jgi:hypothetical protein
VQVDEGGRLIQEEKVDSLALVVNLVFLIKAFINSLTVNKIDKSYEDIYNDFALLLGMCTVS